MASRHYSRVAYGKKRPTVRDVSFCPAGIKDLCRTVVLYVIEQPLFRECVDLMFQHAVSYRDKEEPFRPALESYTCDADEEYIQEVEWEISKTHHVKASVLARGEIKATGGPKVVDLYVRIAVSYMGSASESIDVRFTPRFLAKDLSYVMLELDHMIKGVSKDVHEYVAEELEGEYA